MLPFYRLAFDQYRRGQFAKAIEHLKNLLGQDPNHAEGHALLALCLFEQHRLHAARHEAGVALELEPNLALAHFALGWIHIGLGKLTRAEEHLEAVMALEPDAPENYLLKAHLYRIRGRQVEEILEQALALAPDDPDCKVALANAYLDRGKTAEAHVLALEVLSAFPEHQQGLILMGSIHLKSGELEQAREHAIWALRQNPADHGALFLLSAIKARRSRILGLWWRLNSKLAELGETKAILVLLGAFVLYRIATIFTQSHGRAGMAELIGFLWLGVCIYTWVGPALFHRALHKELATIQLKNF